MKKLVLLMSVVLASCSSEITSKVTEFDRVCNAFISLSENIELTQLSAEDRYIFLQNEIRGLTPEGNARAAWDVIGSAVAEERYSLYKNVVDSIEGGDWSCEAMKQLSHTVKVVYTEEDLQREKSPEPTTLKDASF